LNMDSVGVPTERSHAGTWRQRSIVAALQKEEMTRG
jgi:hypothetical protein